MPPTQEPYKLMRARKGRMIGGVAAGLAQSSGLDVTVVRICIGAAMFSGLGIAAYILMWIVLPEESPKRGRVIQPAPDNTARIIRITLVAVAILSVLNKVDGFSPFAGGGNDSFGFGPVLGLVLLGIGIAVLFSRHRPGRNNWWAESPPPAPARRVARPAPADDDDFVADEFLDDDIDEDGHATRPIATVTGDGLTRSGGAALGWARVIGWLLLIWWTMGTLGVFALWWFAAIEVTAPILLGVSAWLVFIAVLNTLVHAKFARAVMPSLALLAIPVFIAAATVRFDGEVGEQIVNPPTLSGTAVYQHAAGALRLNLAGTEFTGNTKINARNGAGAIFVTLPNDVAVKVTTDIGAGGSMLFGRHDDFHFGKDRTQTFGGCEGAPTVTLNLRTGGGYIEVNRANGETAATCTKAAA